jgi:hypothetical protein
MIRSMDARRREFSDFWEWKIVFIAAGEKSTEIHSRESTIMMMEIAGHRLQIGLCSRGGRGGERNGKPKPLFPPPGREYVFPPE